MLFGSLVQTFLLGIMNIKTTTYVIWLVGCASALIALWFPKDEKPTFLRRIFTVYLATHVLFSIANIADHDVARCFLPIAASVYAVLGHIFIFRRERYNFTTRHVKVLLAFVVLVLAALTAVFSTGSKKQDEVTEVVVFVYYLVCATYAYVGVWLIWRRREEGSLLFFAGCTIGMIDFILPAIAVAVPAMDHKYLGLITRAGDVIFYLPAAVIALRKLESVPGYGLPPGSTD